MQLERVHTHRVQIPRHVDDVLLRLAIVRAGRARADICAKPPTRSGREQRPRVVQKKRTVLELVDGLLLRGELLRLLLELRVRLVAREELLLRLVLGLGHLQLRAQRLQLPQQLRLRLHHPLRTKTDTILPAWRHPKAAAESQDSIRM